MKATSFNVGELVDVKKGAITYAKVTIKTINEETNTIYGTYRTKKNWAGGVSFKPEHVTTWHATGDDLNGRK